jgi:threonine dehydrogenase-like Zn-dependent dehydrogenase
MMARAAVLQGVDARLEIVDLPVPNPEAGALVVDVEYAGICGTDVHLQHGRLPIPTPLGLGHEAVGRVSALSDGVTADGLGRSLSVGDEVAWASSIPCRNCYYCVNEKEFSLCEQRIVYGINQPTDEWPHVSGGWAESIYLRPGSTVLRLPDGVSARDTISLGCAGPTVAHALLRAVPPRLGECVVVQGSGPVGMAAAMFAQLAGAAKVVMLGGPASRLELARSMGAAHVTIDINDHREGADRLELVLAETIGRRGADLVVEAAGVPSAVAEGIEMCRRNGRYVVLGQYTDHGPTLVNPHLITRNQIQVTGSWAFAGEDFIAYMRSLPALVRRFDLTRMVTEYALADVNEALADMQSGRTLKPVLVPDRHTHQGETA